MFVDIRDSTTLTNQLGIMTTASLVAEFFTGAAGLVEAGGGTVGAFNGDGALAIFRGPAAADRSVKAAVGILQLASAVHLPDRDARGILLARSFTVGIGIDQGDVCRALIQCSTAPQQSWIGVNTANKLASIGQPRQSIAVTAELFADIAAWPVDEHMVLSPGRTVRIGGVERLVRTLATQPPPPG